MLSCERNTISICIIYFIFCIYFSVANDSVRDTPSSCLPNDWIQSPNRYGSGCCCPLMSGCCWMSGWSCCSSTSGWNCWRSGWNCFPTNGCCSLNCCVRYRHRCGHRRCVVPGPAWRSAPGPPMQVRLLSRSSYSFSFLFGCFFCCKITTIYRVKFREGILFFQFNRWSSREKLCPRGLGEPDGRPCPRR